MKILIISRTPWNNSNSFGNTFSNIFGGMQGVEIFNICCQGGAIDNNIVIKTLQISEISLIRSFKGGNASIDVSVSNHSKKEMQINNTAKKIKSTSLLFARDLLWFLASYKWKKAIKNFIEEVQPDVIYLPIYASIYMCNIGHYIIKCTKVPVVGHLSDDNWSYSPAYSLFSLSRFYRWCLRRTEYRLIKKTNYLEVFAQNMKEEYESIFDKPCYLIGKGVSFNDVSKPQKLHCKDGIIHFIYTGGLGIERYSVLLELGKALERQQLKKCVLDIYSASVLTTTMKSQIKSVSTICFHGSVNSDDVKKIQKNGDYLVHVEGFSENSISSTRMSFSTKIIDYLATGNILFAIGPREINSVQVIANHNCAVIVDDIMKLDSIINKLLSGRIDTEELQKNAYNYLTTERLKKNIQKDIYKRMLNTLKQRNINNSSYT